MNKIFVGNLPWSATEQDIKNFFAPLEVKNIRLISDRETGRSRGFAFVEVSATDAQVALSYDGSDFGGRSCTVSPAVEKSNDRRKEKFSRAER